MFFEDEACTFVLSDTFSSSYRVEACTLSNFQEAGLPLDIEGRKNYTTLQEKRTSPPWPMKK